MKMKLKLIVSGCILSLMLLAASCNKQRPENLQNIEATPELQAALFDQSIIPHGSILSISGR